MSNTSDIQLEASLLKIKSLEQQFNAVMTQYKEAEASYIADLNNYKESPQITTAAVATYTMIGIGQDGLLYGKESLNIGNWVRIVDGGYNMKGISTAPDKKGLYVNTNSGELFYKPNYLANDWTQISNSSGVTSAIFVAPDNAALCVASDANIYFRQNITDSNTSWSMLIGDVGMIWIAVAPDGQLYCLNGGFDMYKKKSYISPQTQDWEYVGHTNPLSSFAISPDDIFINVGQDGNLYMNSDYKNNFDGGFLVKNETSNVLMKSVTFVNGEGETPIKCLTKTTYDVATNFCVNKKNDAAYCYGNAEGCLWGANDCNTDADCSKYDADTTPQFKWEASCANNNTDPTFWGNLVCSLYPSTTTKSLDPIENKDTAVLDNLNKQLVDIINQYQKELIIMAPNTNVAKLQNIDLNSIYDQLMGDRVKIDVMLKEYDSLDKKYEDNMLKVDQSNSEFTVWVAFVILIISYLVKTTVFPDSDISLFRMFFWMVLLLLFIICSFQLNKAPGFLLWGIILIFFAVVSMNIIPSP